MIKQNGPLNNSNSGKILVTSFLCSLLANMLIPQGYKSVEMALSDFKSSPLVSVTLQSAVLAASSNLLAQVLMAYRLGVSIIFV